MNVFSQDDNKRRDKVKEGIRFLLSHFEGRQRLFPRKMSTALTEGKQFAVYNKDQILNECIKANFVDCRLNGYPIPDKEIGIEDYDHHHATHDHVKCKSQTSMPLQAPNIIFIDIDIPRDTSQQEIILLLNSVLNTINKRLNGSPTVLWTGNGYHIYIVLNTRPLELVQELAELSDNPSEEFLRFTSHL